MFKNVAGQRVGAQVTASDGTPFTGAVVVYVTGDAGVQAAGSVGAGACVHEGNGYHTYAPAQAETNYDLSAFTFVGTGAIVATVQVYTRTGDAYARLGAPAGASIAADIATVNGKLPALVGGRVDASVGAMAANVLTAAATATDYVTEVQGAAAAALTAYDPPTNAEMVAAIAAGDDATLTAVAGVQTTLGAAGAGLTAVPWNAAWDAEVQSECADALTAYDPPTNAEMVARTLAAADYATAAGVDALPTNAELAAALAAADDATLAAVAQVYARLGAPAGASIAADIAAIDAGGGSGPTAVEIADEVQTRTIAAVTVVNGLAANVITAASLAADAGAEIRTGLPVVADLQTVRLSAAGLTDLLRTALVESYADAGDPPTLSQALFLLTALLSNRRVQGDVLRIYGLDGATQVATFLLDDVAAPTEQIRQT